MSKHTEKESEAKKQPEGAEPKNAEAPEADKLARALEAQRAELEAKHMKELDDEQQKLITSLRELEDAHAKDLAAKRIELETEQAKSDKLAAELDALSLTKTPTEPPKAVRTRAPVPNGAPFITRQTLRDARACQTHTFEKHVGDAEGFYWTADEVLRLYKQDPAHLGFYEARGLVPMLEVEGVPSVAARKAKYKAARKRRAEHRLAILLSFPFARI